MIVGIYGEQGSGKTCYMVKEMFNYHREGKKIYSNMKGLNFPYELVNYKRLAGCEIKNAVIGLDEAHLLLNSRDSMSKGNKELTQSFLTQIAKSGNILLITTQFPLQIDIRFRNNSAYTIFSEKKVLVKGILYKIPQGTMFSKKYMVYIELTVIRNRMGFPEKEVRMKPFLANDYYHLYDRREAILLDTMKE